MTKMAKHNLDHFQILPINRRIIYLVLFLSAIGCNMPEQTGSKKLLGKWVLQEEAFQINYPILYFNTDSSAVFTSHGDTIYRFKFNLRDTQLLLKDVHGKETKWEIKKLSENQLVFGSLFENEKQQVYKREPNDINNK
jgi:hypothetical protein